MKPDLKSEIYPAVMYAGTLYEGEPEFWFIKVWEMLERDGLTEYSSIPEKMQVYARAAAICTIYQEVTARLLEFSSPDDVYLHIDPAQFAEIDCDDEPERAEDLSEFIEAAIRSEDGTQQVFSSLRKHLGVSRTFAAIYYCLNYERFSLREWENDEYYYGDVEDPEELFQAQIDNEDYEQRKRYEVCENENELLDLILNEVELSKLIAFEWLGEYM